MEEVFLDWAEAIHRENPVVDAHLDLAAVVYERRLAGERDVVRRYFLDSFRQAHLDVVVSSIYVSLRDLPEAGLRRALGQICALKEDLESLSGEMEIVTGRRKLDEALYRGKTAVLLSLEGLDPLGEDLSLLRTFYDLGVRGASLTWSRRNAFATGSCPAGEDREIPGGLTEAGKKAIGMMEELGMYLDVSHLNKEGFRDVLKYAKKPFIASHSNARRLHPTGRNLDDRQIEAIKDRGGVVGLNACSLLTGVPPSEGESHSNARRLHPTGRNLDDRQIEAIKDRGGVVGLNACSLLTGVPPSEGETALERLCEHAEYLTACAGPEAAGCGFDLCRELSRAVPRICFETEDEDVLAHHGEMKKMTAMLLSRGMREETIAGLIGGNFLRYFRRVLPE